MAMAVKGNRELKASYRFCPAPPGAHQSHFTNFRCDAGAPSQIKRHKVRGEVHIRHDKFNQVKLRSVRELCRRGDDPQSPCIDSPQRPAYIARAIPVLRSIEPCLPSPAREPPTGPGAEPLRDDAFVVQDAGQSCLAFLKGGIWTSQELRKGPSESRAPNRARINVTSYPVPYTQVLRVPQGKQISIARRFADGGPFHAQEWIAQRVCCLSIHPSGRSFLIYRCIKRRYPN